MGTALALGPVALILILDRAIRMWAYHPGITVIRLGRLLGVLLLAHRIQSMEQTALAGTARFSPEQAGAGGPHGAGGDGERGVIEVRAARRPRAGPSDCGRPATDRRTQVSPGYLEAPDPPPPRPPPIVPERAMARETCPYCRGSGHPSAYACLGRCYLCGESVEAPRHLGAEDIAGARQLIRRYRRRIVHEVCGAVARDLDPAFALERPGWANPPPGPSPA